MYIHRLPTPLLHSLLEQQLIILHLLQQPDYSFVPKLLLNYLMADALMVRQPKIKKKKKN